MFGRQALALGERCLSTDDKCDDAQSAAGARAGGRMLALFERELGA